MPRGAPDWFSRTPIQTVHPVEDFGEVAVRLGSPVILDRRGRALLVEDFNQLAGKWDTFGDGDNGRVDTTSLAAFTGRRSARFWVDYDGIGVTTLAANIRFEVASRIGVSWVASFTTDISVMEMLLTVYDGSFSRRAWVFYDHLAKRLYVIGQGVTEHNVATDYQLATAVHMWHSFKVVIDPALNTYRYLKADGVTYDLSAISINPTSSNERPWINLTFRAYINGPIDGVPMYLDSTVVTVDEP